MYRLVFLSGRYQGKRIVVRQALTLIGRSPDCHLVLGDDLAVMDRHAQLEESGTGVYLSSLTRSAPVLLNERPVTDTVRLAHNDELTFGTTRARFQDIIEPHVRLQTSRGLLQPATILMAGLIVLLQIGLLAFLLDWPSLIIRPEVEALDIARAEERRAREEAEQADGPAEAPASVITLPGTATATDARPPASSGAPRPGIPDSSAAEPAPAIQQLLDEADFKPASTNFALPHPPEAFDPAPRQEDIRRWMTQATAAADFSDYPEAIRLLNRIHQTAPDYLPAHAEHARILERRGDPDGARQRWQQIQGIAPADDPLLEKAREHVRRLDELRARQTGILRPEQPPDLTRLPRQVRIVSPDCHRLPAEGDVAEMRVLNAILELSPAQHLFKDAVIQVFITFFDHSPDSAPRPTRAITTPSPMILREPFAQRRSLAIEATYVVARGMRARESRETGRDYAFYGYTIHVFAGEILQDAFARPRRLLDQPLQLHNAASQEP